MTVGVFPCLCTESDAEPQEPDAVVPKVVHCLLKIHDSQHTARTALKEIAYLHCECRHRTAFCLSALVYCVPSIILLVLYECMLSCIIDMMYN